VAATNPKKKRPLAEANRHLPVDLKRFDLDRSRLAIMNANNDPLGVRTCLSVSGQMRREGLLAFASTPNWLLPSSRIESVFPITQDCLNHRKALRLLVEGCHRADKVFEQLSPLCPAPLSLRSPLHLRFAH
jgi:hypothetical protein